MREGQSSEDDIPPPLHIIKRGKSMQVIRGSPRKISSESVDHGPDQPLTVVKTRKSQRKAGGRTNEGVISHTVNTCGFEGRSRSVTANTASSDTRDPVTPKPRKILASRRSSSVQVGQSVSPSFLSKLRSLSTRRRSSSKPPQRRYGLRVPSDFSDESSFKSSDECGAAGSCDQSSSSGYSEPPSYLNDLEPRSFDSNSINDSFPNIQTPDSSIPDPYMLVPRVSILPESKTLVDGQSSLWAAIEISGQLSHPRAENSTDGLPPAGISQPPFIPAYHCDVGLSRYGYLYNVKVDILPTTEGSIVDIIGDTTRRTITPGSSLLVLACIQLEPAKVRQSRRPRHDTENLIADLESQLGNARTEFMQVRISYSHSGFLGLSDNSTEDDLSACQTRLETVVTGVIKRHNPTSVWSPRPAPIANSLFTVIASHWGPARANDVMRRLMSSRSCLRKAANCTNIVRTDGSEDTIKPPSRTGKPPLIPRRQASLKQLSPEKKIDPARKIWTELRQTSSGNRPASHTSKANRFPAATTSVDWPDYSATIRSESTRPESKSEVERQRNLIRETAVRNKRSIGFDSLKSLVPSVAETNPDDSKENRVPDSPSPSGKQDMCYDGRKRDGRWSLGGWW